MRFFTGNMVTGRKIIPLPATDGDWEIRRNRFGTLSCDITLAPEKHRALDLRENAKDGRSFLAFAEGDRILEAGVIWDHEYDMDSRRLHLVAEGIWSILWHRFILPAAVETTALLIQSGDSAGQPNPAVATTFTGQPWPAIVKGILQQGFARAGGDLPIVFGADGAGAHDKSYDAASFKPQGEALQDLTELVDGPEVEFRPQFTSDGVGVEWLAVVGDDDQLEITSAGRPHRFDFTVRKPTVRGLKEKGSARGLTSEAWATGGRQAAIALISRAASTLLTDRGFPRFESLSNAHSTVVEQAVLDAYAAADRDLGSQLSSWWEWETNTARTPRLSALRLGDRATVVLSGDGYLPDGEHDRRIAALSGNLRSRWVRVVADEALEEA